MTSPDKIQRIEVLALHPLGFPGDNHFRVTFTDGTVDEYKGKYGEWTSRNSRARALPSVVTALEEHERVVRHWGVER